MTALSRLRLCGIQSKYMVLILNDDPERKRVSQPMFIKRHKDKLRCPCARDCNSYPTDSSATPLGRLLSR
jgi:hypothetical protein